MKISNEAVEARRNYQNEWRRKNKHRVEEYNVKYWQKKADELKQKTDVNKETKHD